MLGAPDSTPITSLVPAKSAVSAAASVLSDPVLSAVSSAAVSPADPVVLPVLLLPHPASKAIVVIAHIITFKIFFRIIFPPVDLNN